MPRLAIWPTPPNMKAKPQIQKPSMLPASLAARSLTVPVAAPLGSPAPAISGRHATMMPMTNKKIMK
jgi:hypothetical protein